MSDLPVIDGLSLGIGRKMAMGVAADIAKVLIPMVAGLTPAPDGLPDTLVLSNGRFGTSFQLTTGRTSTTILVRRDGLHRVRVETTSGGGGMPPFSLPCRAEMSDDGETMITHAMRALTAVMRALAMPATDGGWATGADAREWGLALSAAARDASGVHPSLVTLPGPWSDTGLAGENAIILAEPVRLAFDAHAPRFVRLNVENSGSRPTLRLSEFVVSGDAIDPDRDPMATLRALAMAAGAGALPG